jgi:uncharacterized protein YndB with AHSA1/START domain
MQAIFTQSIHINALPDKVWMVLTNPDKIEQYMYGSRMERPWEEGHPIEYMVNQNGQRVLMVKGSVIKVEPPFYLEHTVFPAMNTTIEDVPENYLTVSYTITVKGNESELTITQQDFTKVAEGEKRYDSTVHGWAGALPKIKKLAEADMQEKNWPAP